ncbi:phosphoheptose isomerase [bacterium]|nr:MAG: phosphoheptose isomerase [bacterium]
MVEKRTEIFIEDWLEKKEVVDLVDQWRYELGFSVEEINTEKPWGAYWKIADWQVGQFVDLFFPEMKENISKVKQNLSPKFLLIAPGERLSWQYHNRRSENWVVVEGNVGIKTSDTDTEPEDVQRLITEERISMEKGLRHRLIGLGEWGLVAEIWVHSEPENPSDEDDVVRLQDDYGR